jgi:hypothetical protein
MAHVTIEYMIMIPVLILQIFIFPLTATIIMDTWADSRRTLELQDAAGYLGSSIQQLYYTVNHVIDNGTMTINLDIPPLIESLAYTTSLSHVQHTDGSYEIMNVTLCLIGTKNRASTLVTLGPNVDWQENLAFNSTSHPLSLSAAKTADSVWLSLYGGT